MVEVVADVPRTNAQFLNLPGPLRVKLAADAPVPTLNVIPRQNVHPVVGAATEIPFAPVVVTVAVVARSADTGGTEPALLTHATVHGAAAVPGDVSVTAPAVDSA